MNATYPLVSIILPVYNGGEYLKGSIESLLKQTYKSIEIIIINDGSTDNSESVISEYLSDERIIFISRENRGLVETLNEGINIAKGIYIARMDADDISDKNRIFRQVSFLKKNIDVAVVGTRVERIDLNGKHISYCHRPLSESQIRTYFVYGSPIAHPSVMFNLNVLCKNDIRYAASAYPAEDFDLWLRLSSKFKIINIPDCLLKYRENITGVSSVNAKKQMEKSYNLRMSHFRNDSQICEFIIHFEKCSSNYLAYFLVLAWRMLRLANCKNINFFYMINIFFRIAIRRISMSEF